MFEASQVCKVSTQKQPDFEFKDKTTITSSELLAYTKAVVTECCMLTFGTEKGRLSKLISKLHRCLQNTLTTYAQRCSLVLPEVEALTEAAQLEGKELAPTSQLLCHWFDFEGQKSSLFYILGPLDAEAAKAAEGWPEDPAEPTAEEREQ